MLFYSFRQHWHDTKMDLNEVFADIVSYAPNIASVSDNDDTATIQSKLSKCTNAHTRAHAGFLKFQL